MPYCDTAGAEPCTVGYPLQVYGSSRTGVDASSTWWFAPTGLNKSLSMAAGTKS